MAKKFSSDLAYHLALQAEEVFAAHDIIRTHEQRLQDARVLENYLRGEQEFLYNYRLHDFDLGRVTLDEVEALQANINAADQRIRNIRAIIAQNEQAINAANAAITELQAQLDSQPWGWYGVGYTNDQHAQRTAWNNEITVQRNIIQQANDVIQAQRNTILGNETFRYTIRVGGQDILDDLAGLRIRLQIMNGEDPVQARLALVNHRLGQVAIELRPLRNSEDALTSARTRKLAAATVAMFAYERDANGNMVEGSLHNDSLDEAVESAEAEVTQCERAYKAMRETLRPVLDEQIRLENEQARLQGEIAHYNRYVGGQLDDNQRAELETAKDNIEVLPVILQVFSEEYGEDLVPAQRALVRQLEEENVLAEDRLAILRLQPGEELQGQTINGLGDFQDLLTREFGRSEGVLGAIGGLLEYWGASSIFF